MTRLSILLIGFRPPPTKRFTAAAKRALWYLLADKAVFAELPFDASDPCFLQIRPHASQYPI